MTHDRCHHGRLVCMSHLCFPFGYITFAERTGHWLGVQGLDLQTYEVPAGLVKKVATMKDNNLGTLWFVNAIPAALGGKGSYFWQLQAALIQELKRRGLKEKGMLS